MSLSTPPLRSSLVNVSIDDFFEAVNVAMQEHLQTEPAPDGTVPELIQSVPKERLTDPSKPLDVVTFKVMEMTPAPLDNNGGRLQRKPIEVERRPHPDKHGYELVTVKWMEEAVVAFMVNSRSNETASHLAKWFHRFLLRYANAYKFFEARGVTLFRFVRRGEDFTDNAEGQELYCRPLMYAFRLQYLETYESRVTTSLSVQYQSGKSAGSFEISAE